MKKIKSPLFFTLLSILLLLASCDKMECKNCENDIDADKTNLRIKNISTYDFSDINVNPTPGMKNYGDLHSGETSCYHNFDKAYDYAYVKMMINGEEFIIQPIDYVGEEELGPGKFTYSIDVVNFAERRLSIEVFPD